MAIVQAPDSRVQKCYYIDSGPTNVALGTVTGGSYKEERELVQVMGIGNTAAKDFGVYKPSIQASGIATNDTATLLKAAGLRTDYDSGLPPTVGSLPSVAAGNDAESLTLDSNPRIDSWSLEQDFDGDGAAQFDVTFGALDATVGGAIGSVTPGSKKPFARGFGSFTVDAATYKVAKIKLDVDNRMERTQSGDAAASGKKGTADVESSEGELVKVTFALYSKYAADLGADSPDEDIDIVWVCTDRSSNSLTLTISDLSVVTFTRAFEVRGKTLYEYEAECLENLSTALVLS